MNKDTQCGSILVMAVILSFSTILLGLAFMTSALRLRISVNNDICRIQSVYDAYAGAIQGFADQLVGRMHRSGLRQWFGSNSMGYEIIAQGHQDGRHRASVSPEIRGIGQSDEFGCSNRAEVLLAYDGFSGYQYISNKERDALRGLRMFWWTPDTMDGRVHSNDTIYISHFYDGPVFRKRVTTSANYIDPPYNHARFMEGWGWAPRIEFPDRAEGVRRANPYLDWGTGPGLGNDSVTEITFSGLNIYRRYCGPYEMTDSSGEEIIVTRCDPPYIQDAPVFAIPPTRSLFIRGKVWISAPRGSAPHRNAPYWAHHGAIDPQRDTNWRSAGMEGVLTVASSDSMIITDDLIYEHARPNNSVPPSIDSCADLLGLISENYIMLGEDAGDTVYINAAMAAIRGSVSVQDIYENYPPGWDNELQVLFIYGSIAQRNRGIMHTTDYPPNHARGFIGRDFKYDLRLEHLLPPYFPPAYYSNVLYLNDYYGEIE